MYAGVLDFTQFAHLNSEILLCSAPTSPRTLLFKYVPNGQSPYLRTTRTLSYNGTEEITVKKNIRLNI